MRKLIAALMIASVASVSIHAAEADTTLTITQAHIERLQAIQTNTADTKENTRPKDFWHEGWGLIGLIGAFAGLATFASLLLQYKAIKEERINMVAQMRLLENMIRHLYRNKVCISAMTIKYKETGPSHDCYPADEHYLKQKVKPEDLHLEQFYKDKSAFDLRRKGNDMEQTNGLISLHELKNLLYNYNTEIDVALMHVKDPHVDMDSKLRDFATLNFKAEYLTLRIVMFMKDFFHLKDDPSDNALAIIRTAQRLNKEINSSSLQSGVRYRSEILASIGNAYGQLIKDKIACQEFVNDLITDIQIECGVNSKGSPKIHIIHRV